jgi:hypothetical protein
MLPSRRSEFKNSTDNEFSSSPRLETTLKLAGFASDKKLKAVTPNALVALGRRGGIAPTHSRPQH